jgi:hypothetical protein
MRRTAKGHVFSAFMLLTIVILGACSVTGSSGNADPGSVGSDLTSGETVILRLVSDADWMSKPEYKGLGVLLPPRPAPVVAGAADSASHNRFFESAVNNGLGAIVGLIVDGITAAIKAEAEKHERQFRQTTYATDFWEQMNVPKYRAIEIIRYADGFAPPADGSLGTPAARVLVAIVPSEYDPRMLLLKPVYIEWKAAKAKVSSGPSGKRLMTLKMNVLMIGAYVNGSGALVQDNLADATFVLKGVNLDAAVKMTATWTGGKASEGGKWSPGPLTDATAGFFFAPRVSEDLTKAPKSRLAELSGLIVTARKDIEKASEGQAKADSQARLANLQQEQAGLEQSVINLARGGAFGLTVAVTETDESKAKETLLQIADFVGAQKSAAVDAAKGLLPKKE